jgi:hypothetical protein
MDCCSVANVCMVSFVASLSAVLGVIVLYAKMKMKEDEKK